MPSSITPRRLMCAIAFVALLPHHDHSNVAHATITKLYPEGTTPCPEVPRLECQHDSHCISGEPDIIEEHAHLGLKTHEDGYHCDCLPGYLGHECQIEVKKCEEGTGPDLDGDGKQEAHSCYNGAKCKAPSVRNYDHSSAKMSAMLKTFSSCDCETLNKATSATKLKVAGIMCEHKSTSFCAIALAGTRHSPNGNQFCTNHGRCKKLVEGHEAHPGCQCKKGWTGDHCEVTDESYKKIEAHVKKVIKMSDKGNGTTGKVLFSILIVCIVGVMGGIVVYALRIRKEQAASDVEMAEASAVEGDLNLEEDVDGSSTLPRGGAEEDGVVEDMQEGGGQVLEVYSTEDDDQSVTKAEII